MPRYVDWPLPLNPPNPYSVYLHSLAPVRPRDTAVYYTKYILGIIGELDVAGGTSARVREWTFPPQLYTSTMNGSTIGLVNLERGKDPKALWCLLEEYHGALIQFLPGSSGLFTRFTTKVPDTPLIYPKDLKFDGRGNLWFIGSTVTSHVSTISRFEPATKTATSWEVPATAMRNLVSIHPDSGGRKVWVSSVDANLPSTTQWIGCLDVASGVLTCFSPDPYLDPPRSIDIVLVENRKPYSVWFTAAASLLLAPSPAVPAIYRLDLASNVFHRHVTDPRTSWPRFLAVDPGGVAWTTDIGRNSIVSCNPARDCGTVPFKSSTVRIRPSRARLLGKEFPVQSIVSTTVPQPDRVAVKHRPCADEYRAAAMQTPDRLQLQLPGTAPDPRLFFVCFGANKIGMLEP